ncbi:DUF4369 domain-containing protein [Proteiniphilum sp. UBA1028]|jgi:hypothetical protein|uniref:DUF4369 domain-containing protein n=1 Tax=Proteiniphilum sp. UBA1028 TaxID=1947251 RepID=UPI000E8FE1B5|nr:DUF4369 domain-containing protein [Proteiniphilum sp. UBA1028]HBG57549.1 hypothetical protein [Porphyromonadaceae bacterium]
MVRWIKIWFCFFILLVAVACDGGDGTSIKGKITNLEYPYIVASYLSGDTLAIDTIRVDSRGRFVYKNNLDTLTTISFHLNNYESAAVVFANNGEKITIEGDARLPDLIKVNGNEINDDITSFKISNLELLTQRGQLLENLLREKEADSVVNNTLAHREEMAKLNVLNHELTLKAEDYIKEHPGKLSSLILIGNFFMDSDNSQGLERVLGYLEGDVTKTQLAARLQSYSEKMKRSAEGAPVPYFKLTDKDGAEIYSYNFNGKYLLLSFISTVGIESRETVELLKNEYAAMDKDSVAFLTIYIDSDIYPIEYVENDSIPWTVIPEKQSWGSDIVETFNVQFVPFNLLVSPGQTIKVRNLPAQNVKTAVTSTAEK